MGQPSAALLCPIDTCIFQVLLRGATALLGAAFGRKRGSMSKNKGNFGKGKAPIEEPDEFVQKVNSLSDVLKPHIKSLVAMGVLIVIGLIGWQVVGWMHEKKAKGATSAYLTAVKTVDAPVTEAGAEPLVEEDPVPPEFTFTSDEERRNAGLQAFATLRTGHKDIGLSKLAGSREARLMLEAGRYDEALAAFKSVTSNDVPLPLRMTALEGVGYTLEAKAMANEDATARQAGLEQALQAFEALQPSVGGPMRDYSLYHQGRILIAIGKVAEGTAKFQQVLSEVPESTLRVAVESRLATLGTSAEPPKAPEAPSPAPEAPVPEAPSPAPEAPAPEKSGGE